MVMAPLSRIFFCAFVSLPLAASMNAQKPGQLRVELGSNHQIKIIAKNVSYGDILRALQDDLGWEVEFPNMADEVKPSGINVEVTDPSTLIRKLFEDSHFGYAIQLASDSRPIKVVVTAPAMQPASTTDAGNGLSPSIPSNSEAPSMSGIAPLNRDSVLYTGKPNEPDDHLPVSMPLSDAAKNMGVPRGISASDVGITNTLPISGAAAVMGTSLGASSDVGSSMAMPLSKASEIIGNPPGVPPGDVGKTIVLPLGNASSSPRP